MCSLCSLGQEGVALVIKCQRCEEIHKDDELNMLADWLICDDCYEDL